MKFPKFIKNLLSRDSKRKYARKTSKNDVTSAQKEKDLSERQFVEQSESKKSVEIARKSSYKKKRISRFSLANYLYR